MMIRAMLVMAVSKLCAADCKAEATTRDQCLLSRRMIIERLSEDVESNDTQELRRLACSPGSHCVVPKDQTWVLDTSVQLATLTIKGTLKWDLTKDDLELKTGNVLVDGTGRLEIGRPEEPMLKKATVYITKGAAPHPQLGKRFLGGFGGGSIDIHGRPLERTWTLLSRYATGGSTELFLKDDPVAMGWQIGDRIGLATTSRGVSEQHRISSIGPASELPLKILSASAGKTNPQWGETAEAAIDGNPASRWCSFAGRDGDHWLSFELGAVHRVTRIRFKFDKSRFSPNYWVEVKKDGSGDWQNTAMRQDGWGGGWKDVEINQEVVAIKIVMDYESMGVRNTEPDWAGVGIYEVQAFGHESGQQMPTVLHLDEPLKADFLGGIKEFMGHHFELAAEVVNLERNVLITGDHDDIESTAEGLHVIMASPGSHMDIRYTRVEHCGQRPVMGRYCLHFHLMKTCPTCTFQGNAVVDGQHIGITIHGTHGTLVDRNVLWDTRAIGIYTEDGNEMNNRITSNAVICSWWEKCSVDWASGDSVNLAGIFMIGMTNDVIGNHVAGHQNCIWTPGGSRGAGHGAAVGKVCPRHSPFGVIRGNVNHDCARFGLYLDNQYPRNLKRDDNGWLTDHSSCDEFTSDGGDNGVVNEIHDELDYHNNFVGQYAMGDVQFVNYTGINNVHNMYWKTSKNFADGRLYHVVDSLIVKDPSDSFGQMQFLGPSGPFTFGMSRTKFLGSNVGCGAICAGQHCGLGGSGGPCDVQYILDNVDFSGVASGERRIAFGVNAADPGFVLPIFTAKDNSLGGYRSITSKHLNGFGAVEGCSPVGAEWDDGYGCTSKQIRRLNVWGHHDAGKIQITGPGYNVGANWGAPVHGMNAGHMPYEPMHRGYGTPVVLGEQYTLTGLQDDMIVEFSDQVLAKYFGHSEIVNIGVGGSSCDLSAADDKSFISPLGLPRNLQVRSTHSVIQAGKLNCGGPLGPTPAPTQSPTPPPTIDTYEYVGPPEVGGWGGKCRCPESGMEYEVGDNFDSCGSLACEGGEVTVQCGEGVISEKRAGWRVTCIALAPSPDTRLSPTTSPAEPTPKPSPTQQSPAQSPTQNPTPPQGSSPKPTPVVPSPAQSPPPSEITTTCENQRGNMACSGQFGNQQCYTCGDRIDWLQSPQGGGKSAPLAQDQVGREFVSDCGACRGDVPKLSSHGYTEVWRDDFEGTGGVDANKWEHIHSGSGFGNNEEQFYTNREINSWVSDGTLKIRARREDYEHRRYTSAKLQTRAEWLYGQFSVRARLNRGVARGTWAASWMMPRTSNYGRWPHSGEIDIMEHVGYDTGKVHGTVHTGCCHHSIGTQVGGSIGADMNDWHTYTVEWKPDMMLFAMDGNVYQTYAKNSDDAEQWPFNHKFYVILNMAVGGNWGGVQGIDEAAFQGEGQIMEIDWVIVEQRSGTGEDPPSSRPQPSPLPGPQPSPAEIVPTPNLPSAPGCYLKQPAASTKCGGPFLDWTRDAWGEENENSGASESSCMARKSGHDTYCEVSTEWYFVGAWTQSPTQNPTQSPTQSPSQSPTQIPTQRPMQSPTQSQTQRPTQSPTPPQSSSPKPTPIVPSPAQSPPPGEITTTCEDQRGNMACSGQFGNQQCYTCGDRIDWLQSPQGGGKSAPLAQDQVGREFVSDCGACRGDVPKLSSIGYTEVWRDDFEGTGAVDANKWEHIHSGSGFGNNEEQFYTSREINSWVSDGTLKIRARREDFEHRRYTSAKLQTRAEWLYGKFSVRARLNRGVARGTWAANWMMPRTSNYGRWPHSGEIDIMEHVGYDTGKVHGTVHTGCCHHSIGTQVGGSIGADMSDWHTYTVEWKPDMMLFAMDGNVYQTYAKNSDDAEQWPFNHKFYVILNLAVGGNWGGVQGIDEAAFQGEGQIMEIDWVIVEQRSGTGEDPPSSRPQPSPLPGPQPSPAEIVPTPTLPSAPGCYLKQPLASTKCGGPFLDWTRDAWGEKNENSGASESSCMARKSGHDAYCEVNTEWYFVGDGVVSPDPTPTSKGVPLDFEPYPCRWQQDLRFASGATFQGVTIRSDGGVQVCRDCAQRCYAQMRDCIGFVMEPSSNEPQIGKCTYFSRIDKIISVESAGTLALTAAAEVDVLTM